MPQSRLAQAEALLAAPLTLAALRQYQELASHTDDAEIEQILDLASAFFVAASADDALFAEAMAQDLI
jgi:hypothetical protein